MEESAKILAVDDKPEVCEVLREILEGSGHTVETALSGEEALRKLREQEFDVLIVDVSGLNVLTEAKGRNSRLEVIVLTGSGLGNQALETLGLRASACIQKPITWREVEVRVEEALAKRHFATRTEGLMKRVWEVGGKLGEHLEWISGLYDLGRRLGSAVDYEDVTDTILDGLKALMKADPCLLFIAEDKGATLYIRSEGRISDEFIHRVKDRFVPFWTGLGGKRIPRDRIDVSLRGKGKEDLSYSEQAEEILIIPLATESRVIGALGVGGPLVKASREEVERLLYIVGSQAASAIARASLYHHTQILASTDGLTGLLNHRAFLDRLRQEFNRARRYHSYLSLIMLDIDKTHGEFLSLKRINDTYGHRQGDIFLREIADILSRRLRESDIIARYGGDEFVVILPETNSSNAGRLAERIRAEIEAHSFELKRASVKTTISLGVSTFPHPRVADPEALVEEADEALYRAKAKGGNTACSAL